MIKKKMISLLLLLVAGFFVVCAGILQPVQAEVTEASMGEGFISTQETILPVSPEEAFDVMTGDISGWWDHSFSDNPVSFYIEPKPGGGFYEIFDEEGNGALHATVIYADRGKLLRFSGPLGLSGHAVSFVVTYSYEAVEEGTKVTVSAHMNGEIDRKTADVVDSVWHHFIFEQLKPWIESGEYRK